MVEIRQLHVQRDGGTRGKVKGREEEVHLLREEEAHEEISAELASLMKQNSSFHLPPGLVDLRHL